MIRPSSSKQAPISLGNARKTTAPSLHRGSLLSRSSIGAVRLSRGSEPSSSAFYPGHSLSRSPDRPSLDEAEELKVLSSRKLGSNSKILSNEVLASMQADKDQDEFHALSDDYMEQELHQYDRHPHREKSGPRHLSMGIPEYIQPPSNTPSSNYLRMHGRQSLADPFPKNIPYGHRPATNHRGNPYLEASCPQLKTSTKLAWAAFVGEYDNYKLYGGMKSLASLFAPMAACGYNDMLDSDIEFQTDADLADMINTLHYGDSPRNAISELQSIKMKFSPSFNRNNVEEYQGMYSEIIHSGRINTSGMTDQMLAKALIDGITYEPLRIRCQQSKPTEYREAVKVLRKNIHDFEIAHDIYAIIALLNKQQTLKTKPVVPQMQVTKEKPPSGGGWQTSRTKAKEAEGSYAAAVSTTPAPPVHKYVSCVNCPSNHHGKECTSHCKFCHDKHQFKDCPAIDFHIKNEVAKRKMPPKIVANAISHNSSVAPVYDESFLEAIEQVPNDILYDSGANGIFVHNPQYFDGPLFPLSDPHRVFTATGASETIDTAGSFTDISAYHTPTFDKTLVGIHQLCSNDHVCIFTKTHMYGITPNETLHSDIDTLIAKASDLKLINHLGIQRDGVYSTSIQNLQSLQSETSKSDIQSMIFQANASYYHTVHSTNLSELVKFWHESLGHPTLEVMVEIFSSNAYLNLPSELTPSAIRKNFPSCAECSIGNMSRKPLPSTSTPRHIEPGEEFQIDLEGPWTQIDSDEAQATYSGCKYTMTAIDMATGMPFGWLLKTRKQLVKYLDSLLIQVTSQHRSLKIIRTDDELFKKDIKKWCEDHDHIKILPCIPYEHGQIGRVERLHRTLRDSTVKCMANKPHLDPRLWGLCWLDCLFKFSTLPTLHAEHIGSPYFRWFGKPLDALKIPIIPFGSIIMAHIPLDLQTKSGPRSHMTYCVGSVPEYKGGLLLFNPETKRTIVRRTFRVMGPNLPHLPSIDVLKGITLDPATPELTKDILSSHSGSHIYVENDDINTFTALDDFSRQEVQINPPTDLQLSTPILPVSQKQQRKNIATQKKLAIQQSNEECLQQLTPSIPVKEPYRSTYTTTASDRAQRSQNRHLLGSAIVGLVLCANMASHISYVDTTVPKSYISAISGSEMPHWRAALSSELHSLISMGVYNPHEYIDIKSIDPKLIIPSKIVLAKVFEPNGKFKKYKIRIVGRGDRYDIDLDIPTYAGTVSSESLRLLIALSAEHDLEMESIDVKTAFLYPPLDDTEVIYMRRPKGLTDADMPPIIRLRKCIYGLPQAAEKFRTHSDTTIRAMGFTPLISDSCVYVKYSGSNFAYIAAHVDDFAIASNSQDFLDSIKRQLAETYEISIISDMRSYCGLHLVRDRKNKTIDLLQTAYAQSICSKFSIDLPIDQCPLTPMVTAETYYSSQKPELNILLTPTEITTYRSMIGCLLYLAKQTRADILFSVCYHARQNKTPTRRHNDGAIRILQYVFGTMHLGLRFKSVNGIVLVATVDASYASHPDLKSHTGCTLHLGKDSGSFLSVTEKQSITADSSTVAEFIAGHTVAKKVMWARNFLLELGPLFSQSLPTVVYEDNKSTIHLFNRQSNAHKTKHIALRYNFIREQINDGHIHIEYLPTEDMTSDILTKALGPNLFLHLRPKLLGM